MANSIIVRLKDRIKSRSLREHMQFDVDEAGESIIVSFPFPWASIYHDGRGPQGPRAKPYIFFANPEDDPRLPSGYPLKDGEVIRSLTPEEFKQARAEGHLVVTNATAGWPGDPFLDGFLETGDAGVEGQLQAYLLTQQDIEFLEREAL
jgi:hypothetical protein